MKNIGEMIFSTAAHNRFIVKKRSISSRKGLYYELRFPGGTNYHKNADKIEQTVKYFKELLMKSRAVIKEKKISKRLISYVNRLHKVRDSGTRLNTSYSTIRIQDIPIIAKFNINNSPDDRARLNNQYHLMRLLNSLSYQHISNAFIKASNKHNVLYHIFKNLANVRIEDKYIALLNEKPVTVLNSGLTLFLTIPKDEPDLKKIWVTKFYHLLSVENKKLFLRSLKNDKVKKYINKLIEKKVYKDESFNRKYLRTTL